MGATITSGAFIELLEKSRLLSPTQVAEVVAQYRLAELPSDRDRAQTLLTAGVLTTFQAERLLAGRYRGFFFDDYKLLEVLGVGGMGWLYAGEEMSTGRKVALKVLADRFKEDRGMVARFELEAKAGMGLTHPNIVRTLKVSQAGDVHYMVMEFVEGIGLHEFVGLHGRVKWQQACDFIRQAALGLHHTHRAGIIHRDVKPPNLLVEHEGNVKIVDFGLALLGKETREDEFSLAMIFGHDCLGTADYMAPEQSRDSFSVDPRADVYGLGCTFYAILSGKVPYPAKSTPEMLEAHRTLPVPQIRDAVAEVPAEVSAIVSRMMAKQPEDRYTTAAQVAEALQSFCQRQPVPFDFGAVVRQRAAQAREKLAKLRKQTAKSDVGSTTSIRTPTSSSIAPRPASKPRQSGVDTMIAEDTSSDRASSSISIADPFDASTTAAQLFQALTRPLPVPVQQTSAAITTFAQLLALDGGTSVLLKKERVLIGRSSECDVRLASADVSAKHCELRYIGNRWRVIDLESRNGTWVNNDRVSDQVMTSGDVLNVAQRYRFRLEYSDEPPEMDGRGWRPQLFEVLVALASLIAFIVWLLTK